MKKPSLSVSQQGESAENGGGVNVLYQVRQLAQGGQLESCLVCRADLQVRNGLMGYWGMKSVTQLAQGKRNGADCAAGLNKVELLRPL